MTEVTELTDMEAAELFEATAQRYLQMSTRDFLSAWDSGAFGTDPDKYPWAMRVAGLLPLVR